MSDNFVAYYRGAARRIPRSIARRLAGPDLQRDIVIRSERDYTQIKHADGEWQVQLPPCCVVCGTSESCERAKETRRVSDDTRAIRAIVITALAIIPLLYFLGFFWTVAIALGVCAACYFLTAKRPVTLVVSRCKRHAKRRKQPQLTIYGGELAIHFKEPELKQAFVRKYRHREALRTELESLRNAYANSSPGLLQRQGSRIAGGIWVVLGVIQFIGAIIETVIVGSVIAMFLSVGNEVGAMTAVTVFGGIYILLRLYIGWTFLFVGLHTIRAVSQQLIANALGSIGFGLAFGALVALIVSGYWEYLPHSRQENAVSLRTMPGIGVPIGFAINSILFSLAGIFALAGRRGYATNLEYDQPILGTRTCPNCEWPVDIRGHRMVDAIHACELCGKGFRLSLLDADAPPS